MNAVILAFSRGMLSLLHPKMLLLSLAPFLVAGLLWGVLGWLYWDTWTAWLNSVLSDSYAGNTLRWAAVWSLGETIKLILAPLLTMLLIVPLVAASALLLIAVFGMPVMVNHVADRTYVGLERRRGGNWLVSLLNGLWVTSVWLVLWVLCLPLLLIPVIGPLAPLLLTAWATARMFSYDALVEHADASESRELRRSHRGRLFVLGCISAVLGSAPTLLWLSGALAVWFLPITALVSVWLFGLIYIVTGLGYVHYCLAALRYARAETTEPTAT
jgi:hypothetical protein